jgi:hypothetical protein
LESSQSYIFNDFVVTKLDAVCALPLLFNHKPIVLSLVLKEGKGLVSRGAVDI